MSAGRTERVRQARAARITGLYAVTPDVADTALLVRKVTAALDGGASVVQYRNKRADATARFDQARVLARLCRMRGIPFIVNDDAEIAADVDADGVHVGEDDPAIAAARERVGSERLIGVSCYGDFERARTAVAAGADYVAFGSFFASTTKPGARVARPELLERARALGVPVVAIGGIDSANLRVVIDAGADAAAIVSALFGFDEDEAIRAAAARLARAFAGSSV